MLRELGLTNASFYWTFQRTYGGKWGVVRSTVQLQVHFSLYITTRRGHKLKYSCSTSIVVVVIIPNQLLRNAHWITYSFLINTPSHGPGTARELCRRCHKGPSSGAARPHKPSPPRYLGERILANLGHYSKQDFRDLHLALQTTSLLLMLWQWFVIWEK